MVQTIKVINAIYIDSQRFLNISAQCFFAHFYFDKTPAQLNLAESIYLAGIIPRPKYYKYSFDSTGNLKPYLASYYRIMTNRMLAKTWITPLDTFNLEPQVKLKGPALKYVVPQDSSAADTLEMNQQFELF